MREPILFLPAMMSDMRLFAHQMRALSADHPVMFCPLNGGERIDDMVAHMLSTAPTRFALVGIDLGAMVAMDALRRAPDRITRVALMDTTPLPESPQHAAAREPLMISARTGRLADAMAQILPASALAAGPGRAACLALVQRMAEDLGATAFIRQSRALQRRRDQQATLRKIKQPALVLCGAEEEVYPVKRHHFMAELIPTAELEVIEGAGHLPPIEAPDAVTEALRRWLARPLADR